MCSIEHLVIIVELIVYVVSLCWRLSNGTIGSCHLPQTLLDTQRDARTDSLESREVRVALTDARETAARETAAAAAVGRKEVLYLRPKGGAHDWYRQFLPLKKLLMQLRRNQQNLNRLSPNFLQQC